jgi:uncharacterized membrane protein YuzA (DUF378 family)
MREILAKGTVAVPAIAPEVVSKLEIPHDLTTPPINFLMGLQNKEAWKDPKNARNKEISAEGASFLQRAGAAVTDFIGQQVFWTLAPAILGFSKGTQSKNILGKIGFPLLGLGATALLYFNFSTLAAVAIIVTGIAAVVQRMTTGRSSFPRARDLFGKVKGMFASKK